MPTDSVSDRKHPVDLGAMRAPLSVFDVHADPSRLGIAPCDSPPDSGSRPFRDSVRMPDRAKGGAIPL